MTDSIHTLRYSDIFFAMYFNGGMSCTYRNHSHVLAYICSCEPVRKGRKKVSDVCFEVGFEALSYFSKIY